MKLKRLTGKLLVLLVVIVFFRSAFGAGDLRLEPILRELSSFSFDFTGILDFISYLVSFEWVPFVGFSFPEDIDWYMYLPYALYEVLVTPFEIIFNLLKHISLILLDLITNVVAFFRLLVVILGLDDIFEGIHLPSLPWEPSGGRVGGR